MLAQAHDRIQHEPDRYIDHIFGEHENGGTSTFYISAVPFEQLGFPQVQSTKSRPRSTTGWQQRSVPR